MPPRGKKKKPKPLPLVREQLFGSIYLTTTIGNRTDLRARLANSVIIGCAEAVFSLGEYLFFLLFITTGVNYLLSGGSDSSAQTFRQVICTPH